MHTPPLLQISGLEVHFRDGKEAVRAVDGIDLSIQPGETLGIVGESGSGKSVTSLAVMRLLPQPPADIAGGQIIWQSETGPVDLLKLPLPEIRKVRGRQIAMIFQEPMSSLNPVFTCGSQVDEALRWHLKLSKKQAKEQTLALFERVKLPDPLRAWRSYPHELSGGQKQRVMIAMALSCSPKLLIADEPTTALDVTVQKAILDLLAELRAETGMSVIFITHDLGVVAGIADRVAVMYKGRVVEQGKVADIFHAPQHPYTKGLLACRPPLDKRPLRLPVVSDFMELAKDGSIREKPKPTVPMVSVSERKARQDMLMEKAPILQVEGLSTWFPVRKGFFGKPSQYVKAVDDVSFEVYPGETYGLVGESGCGKTTLGRTLVKLLPATSGSIRYNGEEVTGISGESLRNYRRKMQIIFQDPYGSLNPRITIGLAIREPMDVHRLHDSKQASLDKALHLMEQVGLDPGWYGRYPHELSGGQRQRVCIARALALEPSFIICDESVSALDVSVQAQILNLLFDLQGRFGLTYIFISHDLSVVRYMADRMAVMQDGKILEQGFSDEIFSNPQSQYTRNLLEAIPKGL